MMSASMALTGPVQCRDVRPSDGSVVKPIWLFTTTWIVPAVAKPGTAPSCSVSPTIPCPTTAASEWKMRPSMRAASVSGPQVLARAHTPEHHRIDRLEVRRVRAQRHAQTAALDLVLRLGAEVVGHIGRAGRIGRERVRALELGEDLRQRLAEHVRHEVRAAAVHGPDDDLLDAAARGSEKEPVHEGEERLGPFGAEALLGRMLAAQEGLELFRLDELRVRAQEFLAREGRTLASKASRTQARISGRRYAPSRP
jgi:hypothetical protein